MAANITMSQCKNCKHAKLMQWFKNPIIAECTLFNERQVAEANRICKDFSQRHDTPEIKHFDSYEK